MKLFVVDFSERARSCCSHCVVHVVLSVSFNCCVVLYMYEQCPLVAGVLGYNQKVQIYTHAHTQLHLVRASLARTYTAK